MKSIKLLLIGLAAAFALTGCGDSSKDTPEPEGDGNVVGNWHLVSWSSLQSADVYLSFSEAGSFDIYQRLYKPEYVHLDGTYSYDKPTLSGRYSDNTPWGSASYRVSFNADGTRMTPASYTHLRAHETGRNLGCRPLLEKKNPQSIVSYMTPIAGYCD